MKPSPETLIYFVRRRLTLASYFKVSFVLNVPGVIVMFSRVFRISSLTAVLAATASASLAADMPYLPPPPPPPEVEMRPTINDWSGPQIGAAIGIASMHSLYLPSAGDDPELSGDSITFTGLAGYNVQYNNLVFGVEGDFTWANITAKKRLF